MGAEDFPENISERNLATIETALHHLRTDALASGNFQTSSDAARVARKIEAHRDEDHKLQID